MKDLAIETPGAQDPSIEVSHRYKIGSAAVASRVGTSRFILCCERTIAMESGTFAGDITAERARLARVDLMIFQSLARSGQQRDV